MNRRAFIWVSGVKVYLDVPVADESRIPKWIARDRDDCVFVYRIRPWLINDQAWLPQEETYYKYGRWNIFGPLYVCPQTQLSLMPYLRIPWDKSARKLNYIRS
jgi:hypothetical protein